MTKLSASDIEAIMGDWLRAACVALSVSDAVDLRVGEPPPCHDERQPAFQANAEIRTGPPTGDVRITWKTAPAEAHIAYGSCRAEIVLSEAACERLPECLDTFLMLTVVMLLRRRGWHHVHGATLIDPLGRGWLLAGNSQSGKSTTTALLARSGWTVGTDDAAFLHAGDGGVAVRAWRRPIALREDVAEMLRTVGGRFNERRSKTAFDVEELGGRWVSEIRPDIVIFPKVGQDVSEAQGLKRVEALGELIRWSAWVLLEPDLAQEHLDLLAALVEQSKSYRVTLGRDLFSQPTRIAELISP